MHEFPSVEETAWLIPHNLGLKLASLNAKDEM